ncbi:MAG: PH domain-containing protein [Methanocalculaceae archaeon]|jgi:membrane protein YdbS with pleckstrin-like domain|nr:PH domain-containing protein [Methanocalculaceae archaeon]
MIVLGEDFKPALKYRPYLAIFTMEIVAVIWLIGIGWFVGIFSSVVVAAAEIGIFAAGLLFVLLWTVLYYKSVIYHLNATEVTWKRGVWFRKTGTIPYTRITNIDVVQGPVMRLFGISNLKIQTAGYSGNNGSAEISIEGIEEPELLRAMIMVFVRGGAPSTAAIGGEATAAVSAAAPGNADTAALLIEVAAIRKLLEERK